jgi:hypothetical protein
MTREELEAIALLEGVSAPASAPVETPMTEPAADTAERHLTADECIEAYHRVVKRRESVERVALSLQVSVAAVAKFLAGSQRDRTEGDALVAVNRELRRRTRPDAVPVDSFGAVGRRRVW